MIRIDPRDPNGGSGGQAPGGPNPMIKTLLMWGGIFMALLLTVSMFSSGAQALSTQIAYSDFREKVAEGTVQRVQVAPDRITGVMRNNQTFSTIPAS